MNKQQPLDPQVEWIKKRMIRLIVISSLIMIIGLLAVFFAIVYKVDKIDDSFENVEVENTTNIKLENVKKIIETSIDNENIMFRIIANDGKQYILIYKNNKLQKQYQLQGIENFE